MLSTLERFLMAALIEGYGKDYELKPDADDETNCCVLMAMIAKRLAEPGAMTREIWNMFMITDPSKPWSPMAGAVALGIAEHADGPIPGRVIMWQKWKDPTRLYRGHSFMSVEPMGMATELPLIIEATPPELDARHDTIQSEIGGFEWRCVALL